MEGRLKAGTKKDSSNISIRINLYFDFSHPDFPQHPSTKKNTSKTISPKRIFQPFIPKRITTQEEPPKSMWGNLLVIKSQKNPPEREQPYEPKKPNVPDQPDKPLPPERPNEPNQPTKPGQEPKPDQPMQPDKPNTPNQPVA